MNAGQADVEALWKSLSWKQRQAVLEMLLREMTETYQGLDDYSKMRCSGPILELIEILEKLRRVPTDAERVSTLEAVELGCRFICQALPGRRGASGSEAK